MLHLLSSGQSTQLHSFTDLSTQFTYAHVNSDRQDFHHAPEANLFVATVPTFGFELMRRNVKACTPSAVAATAAAATALGDPLQRVRKVLLSEISYVACSYGRAPDLAIGRSNGAIHIYNLKRAELSSVRFRHDSARHSVVNLAYNRSNELLAGVFANTDVVLYGMQTGVKMHVFELDRGSTLVRFHPTVRHTAAIASEHGAVTVLDVHTKRASYRDRAAHNSPCPDVCWSPSDPNMLLSAGFDCQLNVYDVRQKQVVQHMRHTTPFSCVALARSAAGGGGGPFVAAGTLKGDLCAYDLRQPGEMLAARRAVYNSQVVRVAFSDVEPSTDGGRKRSSLSSTTSTAKPATAAQSASTKPAVASKLEQQPQANVVEFVPNILGGGRRSMDTRHGVTARPSVGGGGGGYRRLSIDVRHSLGGSNTTAALGNRARPTLNAADMHSDFHDVDESEFAPALHESFDAFFNKCTKTRESLTATATANRRDSLLDMEVRPVRFADISDSEFASTSQSSTTAGGSSLPAPSMRNSLAAAGVVTPETDARNSSMVAATNSGKARRLQSAPTGVAALVIREDDVDYDETTAAKSAPADSVVPSNVTMRKGSGSKRLLPSPRKILHDQLITPNAANVLSSTMINNHRRSSRMDDAGGSVDADEVDVDVVEADDKENVRHVRRTKNVASSDVERLLDERFAAYAERRDRLDAERDEVAKMRHWESMFQMFNIEDYLVDLRNNVGMLMRTDCFVQQLVQLKEENASLERRLAELSGEPTPKPRF